MLKHVSGEEDKMIKDVSLHGWYWYFSDNADEIDKSRCGKWMYFFSDQEIAKAICRKAQVEQVCKICKFTDMKIQETYTGVICFYTDSNDTEGHKRILKFMKDNNLIKKTKTGRFYNISFKFDYQTRNGDYGDKFSGKLTLDQFMDLQTGEFKERS